MRIRTSLAALAAAMVLALPATAADPAPQAVVQTLPAGRILADVRAAANIVAGDAGPKAIDDFLKTTLGEKGFSGLDLMKPLAGYVHFDEKEAEKFSLVLLVPISKEEDFFDFLKRCHVEPEEVKDSKGLYKLGSFDLPQDEKAVPFEVLMRVAGTTAYIGFNVKADKLDPAKLFKMEQIHDPKETALLAYKQFNDRIPPEVLKANLKGLDDSMKGLKEALGDDAMSGVVLSSLEKLAKSMVTMSLECKETGTRVILDTTTGEFGVDTYYTPKPGSDLAKALAARKPSTNEFAGLANETTVGGLMVQMPVGLKEMQDLMVAGFEKMKEEMKKDPPPPFAKDLVDEGIAGLIRTAKGGSWDFAATMNGPDKDGHFTAAGAMSFDNALLLEKAIAANLKDFPAEIGNCIKLNVDTIGAINIHSLDPPEVEESYVKLFGDRKIYFAFGPKGIYVAVGNGAKDALKTAINGKPGPANPFDVLMNPKRLGQAVATAEPAAGEQAAKIFGNEDKTISALSLSISGGDALRLKFSLNLKILPRFGYQWFAMAFGG